VKGTVIPAMAAEDDWQPFVTPVPQGYARAIAAPKTNMIT
jgi:hypothetical protein